MIGQRRLELKSAAEAYLLSLKLAGRSTATQESYATVMRRLVDRLGSRAVRQITADDMRAYLRELADSGISQSSLNVYITILKGFFRWLVEDGEIRLNPMASMKAHRQPWLPVPPLTDDEVRRLLRAAVTGIERVTVWLLLDCGLRAAELATLELGSVDLERREIRVKGKGGRIRLVALNEAPRRALEAYFRSRAQCDGLLWPSGWNRKSVAYVLDTIARRARVSPMFPHRCRHTFASRFLRQTGDALALQQLLGHSSLTMVSRYVAAAEGERAVQVHKRHSLVA